MSRAKAARVRRIAVVTGTRAEYGLLRSCMEAIQKHRKLELQLVVTGMHLLRKFGMTVQTILSDGWRIDARVRMQAGDDTSLDQAVGLSKGVAGIARFLEEAGTDIVVVLGDRIEAMAGALAGTTTGRFVAHIHGGDVATGDIDDTLRHAITKLAHLHLPATRVAAGRIAQMGEEKRRIRLVGAPGLDHLRALLPRAARRKKRSSQALLVQHPCGRSAATEARVMRGIFQAVSQRGLKATVVYPNTDRGHSGIISAIDEHRRTVGPADLRVERSLDRDDYLRLLIEADVLLGNSSSGIIESATAGTPVVNIGPRQNGRQRSGRAIVDVSESLRAIQRGLDRALRLRPIMGAATVYGDGRAGRRIANAMSQIPLNDNFRRKISLL